MLHAFGSVLPDTTLYTALSNYNITHSRGGRHVLCAFMRVQIFDECL